MSLISSNRIATSVSILIHRRVTSQATVAQEKFLMQFPHMAAELGQMARAMQGA
jgi:hypothetical protein